MDGYFLGYVHSASAESAMETRDTPSLRRTDGSESPKKSRNSLNYKEFDHNEGRDGRGDG